MATSGMENVGREPRSTIKDVFNFVPHGHEKALKHAFYNVAALLFVLFSCGAAISVYFVLEAFLRPLLWAVLCGTVLYPFKYRLSKFVREWLRGLRDSGTPMVVGTITIPIKFLDWTSDSLGEFISRRTKILTGVAIGLPVCFLLCYFMDTVYRFLEWFAFFLYEVLGYFSAIWVWTLVIAYLLTVIFWWNPASEPILRALSLPVWIALLFHLVTIAGDYRVFIFVLVVALLITGVVSDMKEANQQDSILGSSWKFIKKTVTNASSSLFSGPGDASPSSNPNSSQETEEDDSRESSPVTLTTEPEPEQHIEVEKLENVPETQTDSTRAKEHLETPRRTLSWKKTKRKKGKKLSDRYFIALIWACVLVRLWMHIWIVQLLPLLFIFWLLKKGAQYLNLWHLTGCKMKTCWKHVSEVVGRREQVLMPKPIKGLGRLLQRGDAKFISVIEDSLDKIITIFIILLLLVTTICVSFLLAMQVQAESMQLIMVSSNLLNSTIANQPDLIKWFPESVDMQKVVDSTLNNAYLYGREWIASKLNSALSGMEVDKTEIQKEILTVWDRVYEEWVKKNISTQTNVKLGSVFSPWNSLYTSFSKIEGLESQVTNLISVIRDNIGTLLSVLDSVWIVLKGNINLALTVVTTTLSLLLGGGTALFNFFVSMIVFITTLFYLLSFSGEQYKPAQWFASLTPSIGGAGPNKLGLAVEEAIRGVFGASIKMAAFYGLYTWLTHTIFDVKIVFIPSALAAFLGAVPFLGTYWAAVPGVIDLLVQGESVLAFLLIFCQFLPTYVVDTAIYADITGGGHPYLTGLAVVGGIYCVGLEGALIGPILLCCLLVAFNVYSSMMKETPTTPDSDGLSATRVSSESSKHYLRRGHSIM
ncbi:transmembrane protein 245-like [Glandiceps talaboti]